MFKKKPNYKVVEIKVSLPKKKKQVHLLMKDGNFKTFEIYSDYTYIPTQVVNLETGLSSENKIPKELVGCICSVIPDQVYEPEFGINNYHGFFQFTDHTGQTLIKIEDIKEIKVGQTQILPDKVEFIVPILEKL